MSTMPLCAPPVGAPEQLKDEEVALRVLEGDVNLFEVIMRRYNRRLYRVTRSILASDVEAEDVVQDAYVRAYVHLADFEGRSKFSTWLTRIAIYEALARKRRGEGAAAVDDVEALATRDPGIMLDRSNRNPEQQAIDAELRAVLERAIHRLPAHYRTVFMMRDVEGMDTAETAECLGLHEQAVKTRLHRARRLLKGFLEPKVGVRAEKVFEFLGPRCDHIVAGVMTRITALRR